MLTCSSQVLRIQKNQNLADGKNILVSYSERTWTEPDLHGQSLNWSTESNDF